MKRVAVLLGLFFLAFISAIAQEPSPFTLSVRTQLTVRAVSVTDRDGSPIEGLRAEDFVVTEDDVPQAISVFEFQKIDDAPAPPASASRGPKNSLPLQPHELRYKDRRLLAFYFDFGTMHDTERKRALEAAREFLETRLTAADLVAILMYSEGTVRMIEGFTDDGKELLGSINRLLHHKYRDEDSGRFVFGQNEGEFNIFSTDRRLMALQTAAGMLGALNQAKSLIYFSSGAGLNVGNQAQLRATLNAAVRANVSIYPIDCRGLSALAPMGNAGQRSPGGVAMYTGAASMGSMHLFQQSQDALYTLAADTGGKAFLDSNNLLLGLIRAQRAITSHYILGYYPTNTAPDGRLRRVSIVLKGPPARLSYRAAYYANKEFSKYSEADKERQLEDALLLDDPITELTIAIELNYFRRSGGAYFVPLAVRIPSSELMNSQDGGARRTVIDFIGEVRNESGNIVTNLRDKAEIELKDGVANRLASSSIQYDAAFTLRPGKYVLKFLARNADTGRIGTYQTSFVVPDLDEDGPRLPISSVILGSQRSPLTSAVYATEHETKGPSVDPLIHEGQKLIPSIARVFSKSRPLYVYLEGYEGESPGGEGLVVFAALYREHEKAFETPLLATGKTHDADSKTVLVALTIGFRDLAEGEYTFQLTVLRPSTQKVAVWRTPLLIVP
jgi:VWFA-related protein